VGARFLDRCHQPRGQPVDLLGASGSLASGADGALAAVYVYSNRFLIVRRGGTSVRAFRGVGEPRTAPKLKGETLAIGGHRITGFRPGPGTRIVAMASSVDADRLYILRGDDWVPHCPRPTGSWVS